MTFLVDLLPDVPNGEQRCSRSCAASAFGREVVEAIERVRRAEENLARAVARALSTDGGVACEAPVPDKAIEWPEQMLADAGLLADLITLDHQSRAAHAVPSSSAPCACDAPGAELLHEILQAFHAAFSAHGDPAALSTTALLDSCHSGIRFLDRIDEFTARDLAEQLRPLGIRPGNVTACRGARRKGYRYADFVDAWIRYIPDLPVERRVSGRRA
ncbi:DUF3631 domain-containing protein [Streptomyces sp. NPDC001407]|uniref:DUF3631 domain-containing protein n=1 Tax=Streptomyces sp. NPDC001407 TaxID=3364573 RepID=UPI00367682E7